jgi:hypothetical protein
MRSPFIPPLCFETPAPALTGYGQHKQFPIAAPGRGLRCSKRKINGPQMAVPNPSIPGHKPFMSHILQLFTRFSRQVDYTGFLLSQFEDASGMLRRAASL